MQTKIDIPPWATHIVSDFTDMDRSPHPVDAARVSSFSRTLPDDVYFEYAFLDGEGRMRADPANPTRAQNPWYPEASAIVGPDYQASPYASLAASLASGAVERHRFPGTGGGTRRLTVYTPRDHEAASLPLCLVFDGTAFMRVGGLNEVLEALVGEGRANPARLAFLEPQERSREYGFDEEYRRFVEDELWPFLERTYPGSDRRMLMGASLGGLLGATLALRAPGRFHGLATFSGAFLGAPEERDFYRSKRSWVLDCIRSLERPATRWYAEVGTIEWLTGVNREVRDALETTGHDHRYRERNAGHNWVNWRNGLADALEFLLGPREPGTEENPGGS
jgi:enterochelin esterase-like enzyme